MNSLTILLICAWILLSSARPYPEDVPSRAHKTVPDRRQSVGYDDTKNSLKSKLSNIWDKETPKTTPTPKPVKVLCHINPSTGIPTGCDRPLSRQMSFCERVVFDKGNASGLKKFVCLHLLAKFPLSPLNTGTRGTQTYLTPAINE